MFSEVSKFEFLCFRYFKKFRLLWNLLTVFGRKFSQLNKFGKLQVKFQVFITRLNSAANIAGQVCWRRTWKLTYRNETFRFCWLNKIARINHEYQTSLRKFLCASSIKILDELLDSGGGRDS